MIRTIGIVRIHAPLFSDLGVHILLVGGSGFIGRHFAERAIAAGHHVTVVSRRSGANVPPPASWLSGGMERLSRDPSLLRDVDVVCQFASVSTPASSASDPLSDVTGNLVPNIRLFDAMCAAGVKRIVYLSSGGAIYGAPLYSPMDEDHPQRPISSYGIVKGSVERYLGLYEQLHGFRPLIVRPANPFGPRQDESTFHGFITTMLKLAVADREATIFGDGSIVRDFVYIDDLCDLLLKGIDQGAAGTFNCGSGAGASLLQILEAIERVIGKPIRRHHEAARPFDPPAIVLDTAKAHRELGWAPSISLEEGILRCWNAITDPRAAAATGLRDRRP